MKIIAHILILLMAVMVAAPCADAFEIGTDQKEQIVQVSNHETNSGYGMYQHQEACSPLCSCQCCPSVASDAPGLSELRLTSPFDIIDQKKLILITILPEIIWSPPQLIS